MRRRNMLTLGGTFLLGSATHRARAADLTAQFAQLEAESGGRLGITVTGATTMTYRADERFPLCSTFKLLAAAAILTRTDTSLEHLDRRIPITQSDLVTYSPITQQHAGQDMSLADLCEAALTMSDNTAGNLMLESLGGPAALTRYARTLGDQMTRLDRTETTLNEATPGDPRDTTTPAAMANNLRTLLFGTALSEPARQQLATWLRASKTGDAKLRAGLPKTWTTGDKTGAGDHGTVNEVAVLWPPNHPPLIAAIYMTETTTTFAQSNALIATIGRTIAETLSA